MTTKLTSQIASVPDRLNVVFEIYQGNNQVAEVSHEPDNCMCIEIFQPPQGNSWQLNLEEFFNLLKQAENNLSS